MKLQVLVPGFYKKTNAFTRNVSSTITLIQTKDKNILVDTGNRQVKDEILGTLKVIGLAPKDITHIINTHLHPDHCWNNYLFENAQVIVPGQNYIYYIDPNGNIGLFEGFEESIKLEYLPGHIDELITVTVNIEDKVYCIASDVISFQTTAENYTKPHRDHKDNTKIIESRKKLLKTADVIIPGHGDSFENKWKGEHE